MPPTAKPDPEPEQPVATTLDSPPVEEALDLSVTEPPAGAVGAGGGAPPPGPTLKDYNPEEDREQMRGRIAQLLLWLLITVVVLSFIVISWCDKDRWSYLKEFLTIVFGPLTTLIGAVTGFYYGSVQKSGKG
jgi:hypothetical protein